MKKKYMSPQISVVEIENESMLMSSPGTEDVERGGSEEVGIADVREQDLFAKDICGN